VDRILIGGSPLRAARMAAGLLLIVASLFPLAALDIAKGELEGAQSSKIIFTNYEGPQKVIESSASIKGIGSGLAAALGSPAATTGKAGSLDRYAVIRLVDPSLPQGLDADLIVIGKDALVDHIANIRRIIAGYLETAWGYSPKDAATLAVFVTVYNAVHRGDLAYFATKYKPVVMKEIDASNAGLSTRWDEWAGKTRILIPLSSGAKVGAAGAVSTATVSDKAVTANLQAQAGAGVAERQDLVAIKEKEIADAQAAAAKAKADAAAADAAAAAAKADLAKAQADLTAAKTAAPTGSPTAAGNGEAAATGTTGAVGTTQTAEVAKAEQAVATAQATSTAADTKAADTKAQAGQAEAAVAAKQAEVAADRASITQDQKAVIAAEVAASGKPEPAGIWLLEAVDSSYPFVRLIYLDPQAGKLIRASTINTIRARSILDAGQAFVAVAGRETGTGAVRLVAVDKATLIVSATGAVDIYPESVLAKFGDSFYAVIKAADGKYYLGRFDARLSEAARSKEAVNPLGGLVQGADGVVAQAAAGGFLSLDASSLALVKKLPLQ